MGKVRTGASQVALVVKNLPANSGDPRDGGWIPGLERSPGEGNGNPLQYSCLENSTDGGAWWAPVSGFAKIRHDWSMQHAHKVRIRTQTLDLLVHPAWPCPPPRAHPHHQLSREAGNSCWAGEGVGVGLGWRVITLQAIDKTGHQGRILSRVFRTWGRKGWSCRAQKMNLEVKTKGNYPFFSFSILAELLTGFIDMGGRGGWDELRDLLLLFSD